MPGLEKRGQGRKEIEGERKTDGWEVTRAGSQAARNTMVLRNRQADNTGNRRSKL